MGFDEVRTAFVAQGTRFVDLVDATPDLATPSPLDGWDAAVLVGHVSTSIEVLWRWRGDPSGAAHELDRVNWWDAADPDLNDSFAQRYAAKRSHDELRATLAASIEQATALVATTDADETLAVPGGAAWATFGEVLATRVFELTVHGIDLAAVTGAHHVPDAAALAVSSEILDRRLAADRPNDLSSDLDWVLAATGRRNHADPRLPVVQ